jgi:hypothetical protein
VIRNAARSLRRASAGAPAIDWSQPTHTFDQRLNGTLHAHLATLVLSNKMHIDCWNVSRRLSDNSLIRLAENQRFNIQVALPLIGSSVTPHSYDTSKTVTSVFRQFLFNTL